MGAEPASAHPFLGDPVFDMHVGGKVTVQPEYVVEKRAQETVFRNYRGERFSYPEPRETDCSVPYDEVFYGAVAKTPPRLRVLP